MTYQIITDEAALKAFIDWLPDLAPNEKFYCSLFSRKKYAPDVIRSQDKTQLRRFTASKDRLFQKIKQLEVKVGAWQLKTQAVPQESLVVYINPNPRSMKKATFMLMREALKLMEADRSNYNIHAEALSCIQKSKSYSYVVDFDIDTKAVDLSQLSTILPKDTYDVLETRGGYHVLVNAKKAPKTNWYQAISKLYPIDQVGDNMIPIPGTYQGGFTPKFL